MASVTLLESAKLAQNELISGVIENVITVNRLFDVLPFDAIDGNALAYNRENVLGAVIVSGIDDDLTQVQGGAAKQPATFTQVTSSLTTLIGDAEVNGLIQATRSGDGNDQRAVQVASKAKSCGRQYQNLLINGTGTGNQFPGLIVLCDSTQIVPAVGGNGDSLSFTLLDNLMDLVTDKDGQVDYFTMNARTIRSYYALLRAQGGAQIGETMDLPSGATVPAYRGTGIFRNDWIPINQTTGSSTSTTSIFAGTLDDGSRSMGIAGLTAANAAGIQVVDVGESEFRDNTITRVKWYSGLALFSARGLAMATGITN